MNSEEVWWYKKVEFDPRFAHISKDVGTNGRFPNGMMTFERWEAEQELKEKELQDLKRKKRVKLINQVRKFFGLSILD